LIYSRARISRPRVVVKRPIAEIAAPSIDSTAAVGGQAINIVRSTWVQQASALRALSVLFFAKNRDMEGFLGTTISRHRALAFVEL
jgi:hypothetical protein